MQPLMLQRLFRPVLWWATEQELLLGPTVALSVLLKEQPVSAQHIPQRAAATAQAIPVEVTEEVELSRRLTVLQVPSTRLVALNCYNGVSSGLVAYIFICVLLHGQPTSPAYSPTSPQYSVSVAFIFCIGGAARQPFCSFLSTAFLLQPTSPAYSVRGYVFFFTFCARSSFPLFLLFRLCFYYFRLFDA